MTVKEKLKLGSSLEKELGKLEIPKQIKKKVSLISAFSFILGIFPFFLILINLLKFMSTERLAFYILAVCFVILYFIIMAVTALISVHCYKYYTKEESLVIIKTKKEEELSIEEEKQVQLDYQNAKAFFENFDTKSYFLYSLFNRGNLIALIVLCSVLVVLYFTINR